MIDKWLMIDDVWKEVDKKVKDPDKLAKIISLRNAKTRYKLTEKTVVKQICSIMEWELVASHVYHQIRFPSNSKLFILED